eukprot:3008329-Pyramimonas_sp.AAC.1
MAISESSCCIATLHVFLIHVLGTCAVPALTTHRVSLCRFIWEETVRPVYPSAKAIEGRIERVFNAREWLLPLVEVFVIDTAKTHDHLLTTVRSLFLCGLATHIASVDIRCSIPLPTRTRVAIDEA